MKLSKQQCQRIANYIAEAYSYPDNESDLAGAKLKVRELFSKSLRHFEIGAEQNTIKISNNDVVFANIMAQLAQQNYILPQDFNYTFIVQKRNFRKSFSDSKQILAEELEDSFEIDNDSDFDKGQSEEEYDNSEEEVIFSDEDSEEQYRNSVEELMTSDVVEEDTGEQTVWGPFDTLPAMKVALTTACRDTFEKLSPHEVLTAYLCGGAVLDLIENTTKANDLDFVISLKDINFLNLLGYRRDAYNNNSYFINSPYRVDVKVLPYAPFYHILEMGWMREDIKTRDFNICKLYCDRDGSIYDPTGRGLFDLNARILSMAGNEKEKLENSPARIIRAMKYMQRGFYPDDALDFALRNFNSLHPEKISHVYSVTRKLLKNSDDDAKQVFLDNLRHYGLLGTLFGLDNESTLDDLSARISPKPPIFYGTIQKGAPLLFQKPGTDFSQEISCEQNADCNLF